MFITQCKEKILKVQQRKKPKSVTQVSTDSLTSSVGRFHLAGTAKCRIMHSCCFLSLIIKNRPENG